MSCLKKMTVKSLWHVHNFTDIFSIADELEKAEPLTVNIRERAGGQKTAIILKIAALIYRQAMSHRL